MSTYYLIYMCVYIYIFYIGLDSLTESAHIMVSTIVWLDLIKPLFPLGSRGCAISEPFTRYSGGHEFVLPRTGAATALILWGKKINHRLMGLEKDCGKLIC